MNSRRNPETRLAADQAEIRRALGVLFQPGDVVELRVLDAATPGDRRPHVESGYFDDWDKLTQAAAGIPKAKGWYVTINPVNPALLARAQNRVRPAGRDPTTSDKDIPRRLWLPIDLDAVRPAGISATDAEHEAAIQVARDIFRFLVSELGWPEPVIGDSGNGAHVMAAIGLPADDGRLVERCLKALAARFDTAAVKVDTTTHNPAGIWKLYGTLACKGDHTPERPHRLARLLCVPEQIEPVPIEKLQALAAEAEGPGHDHSQQPRQAAQGNGTFDLAQWIAGHGLDVIGPEAWQDGRRWVFRACPWNRDHTNRSAYIVQHGNGAIGAGCHHNGCQGKGWHELRDVVEPGWRERRAGQKSQTVAPRAESWPEPHPLPTELLPVQAFSFDLLPEAFRAWVEDIATRMQCPPDFPAVGAMVALASLVGRQVGIHPKRHDDWLVIPNLWGAVIGRPGIMKTPALREPLRPLQRLEVKAKERFEAEHQDFEARKMVAAVAKKEGEAAIRKALKDRADAVAVATELVSQSPETPVRRRYLVNDSTVEKLGALLNENPNGLLVYRDELVGLLRNLDKEGQEGARAFYLEAWDGGGRFTYDRIGRGTLDIVSATVSVIGGIQPGRLGEYLRGAVRGGADDDGLMQRYQLAVWPDVSSEWINVDRWPDTPARQLAYAVFERLDDFDPSQSGAEHDGDDKHAIPFLRFSEEAQGRFNDWRAALERKIRSGEEHPAVEAHLAKYRSLVPSLALLIHLADHEQGSVGLDALQRAICWSVYLESHTRRIYGVAVQPDLAAARALAKKILDGAVGDGFALRDVYRNGWSGLSEREDARLAVGALLDLDCLREERHPTAGRNATRYRINPKILKGARKGTDKTDKSPPGTLLSALSVPGVAPSENLDGPVKPEEAADWGEL